MISEVLQSQKKIKANHYKQVLNSYKWCKYRYWCWLLLGLKTIILRMPVDFSTTTLLPLAEGSACRYGWKPFSASYDSTKRPYGK